MPGRVLILQKNKNGIKFLDLWNSKILNKNFKDWIPGYGQYTLLETINENQNNIKIQNLEKTNLIADKINKDNLFQMSELDIIKGNRGNLESKEMVQNLFMYHFRNIKIADSDEKKEKLIYECTKEKPSPYYFKLIENYMNVHGKGLLKIRDGKVFEKVNKAFPGKKPIKYLPFMSSIFKKHNPKTLLDYGGGKGGHYELEIVIDGKKTSLKKELKIESYEIFEPGFQKINLKSNKYDCVICTDVMEHIHATDVTWVLNEIFSLASLFVFCNSNKQQSKFYQMVRIHM